MDKPPSRYDVTIRVAKEDGHQPDPAAFAVIASQAASSRNASDVSALTAQEITCLVSVAAPDRPSAVAVALAAVADALKAEGRVPSPSR
jgi:thiamine monophosphate kinase